MFLTQLYVSVYTSIQSFLKDKEGASAIEYAVIVAGGAGSVCYGDANGRRCESSIQQNYPRLGWHGGELVYYCDLSSPC